MKTRDAISIFGASGILSPAGGATDACDSGASPAASLPATDPDSFDAGTCFSSAAIFSLMLVHCWGYRPPAIFAAASILSRSLSTAAIALLAPALSCAPRAVESVCASPARLAAGARIGPGLPDAAFIRLSIANAWSLNSSACASCAKAWRGASPIEAAKEASNTIVIVVAIRCETDPTRVTRATLLCATASITPLDQALRRLPVALCCLLYLTRELQEHLPLVIDKERESTAGTDNQTEDKSAHSSPSG